MLLTTGDAALARAFAVRDVEVKMNRKPITIVVQESPQEQEAEKALIALGFNVLVHLSADPHKVEIKEPE
jgi:hypothetical protein